MGEFFQIDETTSWEIWKSKAGILYRIRDMARSFSIYTLAFLSLLEQSSRVSSLSHEEKKGAAKILTNISILYLNSSALQLPFRTVTTSKTCIENQEEQVWNIHLIQNGFCDLPSSTAALLKAVFVACYATKFNVCWSKSYVRMKAGVKGLKEKYSEFLENEKKTKKFAKDTRLKTIINEDKKLRESDTFWDASEFRLPNNVNQLNDLNPSLNGSELTNNLTDFRASVNDYKNQLQTATTEILITLVNSISRSLEDLRKSSLEYIKQNKEVMSMVLESANSDPNFKQRYQASTAVQFLAFQVEDTLMWDIELGIYAVRWDPTNAEKYESLLESLESYEKLIEQLQNNVKQVPEEECLNLESGISRFRDGLFL